MGTAEALGGLRQNMLDCAFGIGQHIGIPEPNDAPSLGTEKGGTALVSLSRLDVLAAVKLDGQPGLAASKIDDEWRFDQLTGEGWAIAGDALPYRQLRRCGIIAQFPCPGGQV